MKRFLYIYLLIFREFIIYTMIFTGLALLIYLQVGWPGLVYIFWTKVVGFASICGLYHFSKQKQLIFFHNLGLSIPQLLVITASSDIVFFLISISIVDHLV